MIAQENSVQKKRGRPRGRIKPETVPVRLEADAVRLIDDLIAGWPDKDMTLTRSDVIRYIVAGWIKANS